MFGAAIVVSRGAAWLGCSGILAGAAAFLYGVLTFVVAEVPEEVLPPLVVVVSLWTLVAGLILWYRPGALTGS